MSQITILHLNNLHARGDCVTKEKNAQTAELNENILTIPFQELKVMVMGFGKG